MAAGKHTFVGGAKAVQQITTITVGSNTDTHTFIISALHPSGSTATAITICSDTASSDTTTTIATELAAQWNASRFSWAYGGGPGSGIGGATATSSGAVVTLTAKTAGLPFRISTSGTGTLTTNVAGTGFVANSGPDDLTVAGNWADGVVPDDANDDLFFTGPHSILFGLDQDGVAIANAHFKDWSGRQCGWPGQPLLLDPNEFIYDCPRGGHAYIHVGTADQPITGWNCGKCLYLTGGNASSVHRFYAGRVELAPVQPDVFTGGTVINYGADIKIGPLAVITNYRQSAGSCHDIQEANRTLTHLTAGNYLDDVDGTTSTFNNYGARAMMLGVGTISAGTLSGGFTDFNGVQQARSVTASYMPEAAAFNALITGTQTALASAAKGNPYQGGR